MYYIYIISMLLSIYYYIIYYQYYYTDKNLRFLICSHLVLVWAGSQSVKNLVMNFLIKQEDILKLLVEKGHLPSNPLLYIRELLLHVKVYGWGKGIQ